MIKRTIPVCILSVAIVGLLAACSRDKPADAPQSADAVEAPSEVAAETATGPAKGTSGLIPVAGSLVAFDMAALEVSKPTTAPCALDKVAGTPTSIAPTPAKAGQELSFEGWIVTPRLQVPPEFALVLRSEKSAYALGGTAGSLRPDVAGALKSDAAMNAGFKLSGVLTGVVPGTYSVSLVQDSDDLPSICDVPFKLEVVQ